ncbi:hypothetical protein RF11_02653 [Thelohanellus kitauei]|uniref:MULE transposase domain-containing protein n=1 Tax=Thelohanellus kitauei TaxID=669202 RepID=A0A0C2IVC2_THEKT|nr:hypothetical protein RF11_02653 [Thelohanellus kitauei]
MIYDYGTELYVPCAFALVNGKSEYIYSQIPDAVEYIKCLLVHEEVLDTFWLYFQKTWLVRFPSKVWNTFDISKSDIMNRTNNALERYNRRMNDFFANAHPNLVSFPKIIRDEFKYYEERCTEIHQNSSGIIFRQVTLEKNDLRSEFN